jgi:type IV pilus assembly protein PilQ
MSDTRVGLTISISLLFLTGLMACAPLRSGSTPAAQGVKPLERIGVNDLTDRIRIELDAGRPITYAVSSTVAPASVTVTLPGLSRGSGLQRMELKQEPVTEIVPNEVSKPRQALELTFKLTAPVKPEVRAEGSRLFIDFPKAQADPARIAKEDPGAPAQIPSPIESAAPATTTPAPSATPSGTPARRMTKVEVQREGDEAIVVIHGDGEFQYDVRALNQDRLIVDLSNVVSPLRLQVLPVDHSVLKQIRIGHHSQKVRLVLDLPKPASYTVQQGSNSLAVRLIPLQPMRPEPAAAKAAPEAELVSTTPAATVGAEVLERRPRLAQMAPEIRGTNEPEPEETGQRRYVGRRISLDFQAADITNVLRLIAEVSGFNIVVGEGVKAKVTLKLTSVPWDQALDMLLKMNNLGMIREGNIVWIDTLSNISRQQDEEAKAKESKIKAEDLVTRVIYVQNITAAEVQATLRQYLSSRGQINVNAASNALVVQDTESRIANFLQLVRELDLQVPQVQIEARIVQADTNFARSLGIQWGFTRATVIDGRATVVGNQTGGFSPLTTGVAAGATTFGTVTRDFMVNLPAAVPGLNAVPGIGFMTGRIGLGPDLDLRLSAGELLGLTKVIAAPKITTLDKREAKIEQGESIPFQTTSLQGTQTTFVDANLTLQVTPQITSRDPKEVAKQILLKIRATRNFVGARSNPAGPSIAKREATTQVVVRDGETMVIGGVFIDEQSNTVAGFPWLSRIPVIGWLFKNKVEAIAKQELLIFLTPTIVKI